MRGCASCWASNPMAKATSPQPRRHPRRLRRRGTRRSGRPPPLRRKGIPPAVSGRRRRRRRSRHRLRTRCRAGPVLALGWGRTRCKAPALVRAGGRAAPTGGRAAPTGRRAASTGVRAAHTGGRAASTGGRAAPTGGRAAPTGGRAAPTGPARGRTASTAPALGRDRMQCKASAPALFARQFRTARRFRPLARRASTPNLPPLDSTRRQRRVQDTRTFTTVPA